MRRRRRPLTLLSPLLRAGKAPLPDNVPAYLVAEGVEIVQATHAKIRVQANSRKLLK
jgi:hypothetical protein